MFQKDGLLFLGAVLVSGFAFLSISLGFFLFVCF